MDNTTNMPTEEKPKPKIDFKALMAGSKLPKIEKDVKDATKLVEKAIVADAKVSDLQKLLLDRSIPLGERNKIKERLAKAEKQQALLDSVMAPKPVPKIEITESKSEAISTPANEQFSLDIVLNKKQQFAAELAGTGKSFVFTGKAGTGKTTGAREIARSLLKNGILGTHYFGYYKQAAPSIAFVAMTNRAADNMRRSLHKDPWLEKELPVNILTCHKLMEYTMEWAVNAEGKKYPRFFPQRDAHNKLDITHLIIEESSMLDIPFWRDILFPALRPGCVIIMIGDINQLPPVFGPSVMNYGLIKLPVVELDEVYRQALDSPILSNALKVLDGHGASSTETNPDKKLTPDGNYFKLYQSKAGGKLPSEQSVAAACINSVKKWIEDGSYDVTKDIILTPFNKDRFPCGSKMLNYHMAQYLGDKRKAKVHEVIAGRQTWYLAEGDRVMIDKQDGFISKISINASYIGKNSKSLFCDINRFGQPVIGADVAHIDSDEFSLEGYENLDVDDIPDEDKKVAASHMIDIKLDDGETRTLDSAGEFSDTKFNLGYCLSVHKAQGSEWRKVVLVIHKSFSVLLFRELIYTAMTRAREYLTIVDLSNALNQAIKTQRIKGNTIKDKIEYFNSKITLTEDVQIIP